MNLLTAASAVDGIGACVPLVNENAFAMTYENNILHEPNLAVPRTLYDTTNVAPPDGSMTAEQIFTPRYLGYQDFDTTTTLDTTFATPLPGGQIQLAGEGSVTLGAEIIPANGVGVPETIMDNFDEPAEPPDTVLINGEFTTDLSNWGSSSAWTWSAGTAVAVGDDGFSGSLEQTIPAPGLGETYTVTIDAACTAGSIRIRFGDNTNQYTISSGTDEVAVFDVTDAGDGVFEIRTGGVSTAGTIRSVYLTAQSIAAGAIMFGGAAITYGGSAITFGA